MTKAQWILLTLAILVNVVVIVAFLVRFSYAPIPDLRNVVNPDRYSFEGAYDVMGRLITVKEANDWLATEGGARQLSPAVGAIQLTPRLVEDGRKAFYEETFGNERFLTDVVGILDGGLSAWDFARALLALAGRGTNDLQVHSSRDVQVGDRVFPRGTKISTGLDVPRGGWLPLGVRVFYDRGTIRVGVTCAACHATVDRESGRIVEGAPNTNLNVGLLLALASNSAAYYLHTSMPSLEPYLTEQSPVVRSSTGVFTQIPEPDVFEVAVSEMLAQWPPGTFDATIDRVNNPTSIPDAWTAHDDPYGWSGFAAIGPFRGLSALNNDLHGLGTDATALADVMPFVDGPDPEVYLAILLQRAANPAYRFEPHGEKQPAEVLRQFGPSASSAGLNRTAALPTFPRANYVTQTSLIVSREREPIGYAVNAMSAFQDSLKAPPRFALNREGIERGRTIFESAGCGRCHGGRGFNNHRIVPVSEVRTEPSRARALRWTKDVLVPPVLFAPDTPFPPPSDAKILPLALTPGELELLHLGWAQGTEGGYKVKGLVGLEWSAPYLHDGGVAVGPDPSQHLGIPGTIGLGIVPDARNSLRALFDRELRERVVAINRTSAALASAHVTGEGHEYWVDVPGGYTLADQEALLDFLFSLREVLPRRRGGP